MGWELGQDWGKETRGERGRNEGGILQGFDSTDNKENQTRLVAWFN